MKRWLTAAIAAATMLCLGAQPAQALTKTREALPLTDHATLSGFCDFPVVATDVAGHVFQDVYTDANGDLVRIAIYSPGLRTMFEANGESVTVQNSGPVLITIGDDGVFTVHQFGQSVSADQGLITGEPFLVHVSGTILSHSVPNPTTGFVDFLDTQRTGVVMDICAALTP
jgi:hypothetical protein